MLQSISCTRHTPAPCYSLYRAHGTHLGDVTIYFVQTAHTCAMLQSISCTRHTPVLCYSLYRTHGTHLCHVRSILCTRHTPASDVCPSAHMCQLDYCWMDFHEILYWGVSLKFVDKFQFWLKSDDNNGHFTWTPTCVSVRGSDLEISWGNPQSDASLTQWSLTLANSDISILRGQRPCSYGTNTHPWALTPLIRVNSRTEKQSECDRIVTLCVHFLTCFFLISYFLLHGPMVRLGSWTPLL
jgi:hypothetical protein